MVNFVLGVFYHDLKKNWEKKGLGKNYILVPLFG